MELFFPRGHCNLVALLKHLWITKLRTTYRLGRHPGYQGPHLLLHGTGCLFIDLWVLPFPLEDCSVFGNFVITLTLILLVQQFVIKWRVVIYGLFLDDPIIHLLFNTWQYKNPSMWKYPNSFTLKGVSRSHKRNALWITITAVLQPFSLFGFHHYKK